MDDLDEHRAHVRRIATGVLLGLWWFTISAAIVGAIAVALVWAVLDRRAP